MIDQAPTEPVPAPRVGEEYVVGGVMRAQPCGCEIEGRGTLPDPLRIAPCKRHLAEGERPGDPADLIRIAGELVNRYSNTREGSPHRVLDREDADALRAALAKAKGR